MPTLTSTTGLGGVTLASRQKVIFHQEICWRGRGSKTQNCIICHHFLSSKTTTPTSMISKTTPRWRSLFFQPLKRNQWFRRPPWHVLYTSHSHNLISLAYNSLCGACARWPKNWYLVKSMLPNLKGLRRLPLDGKAFPIGHCIFIREASDSFAPCSPMPPM